MTRPALLALALSLAPAGAAGAAPEAPEPIDTDRPDLTDGAGAVGKGRFQIESGVLREHRGAGRARERSLSTPLLFRWGVAEGWEARVATDGYSRLGTSTPAGRSTRTAGFSSLAVGFKRELARGRGRRPALGVIAGVGVPSGSGAFRSRRLTGSAALAAGWELGPGWALGANAGIRVDEDDAGKGFTAGFVTGSLERELSSRWAVFAETASQAPEHRAGGASLLFDGGVTYLLDRDTQIDFAAGTGAVGRTAPDFFWTVGFSRRFR